MSKGEAPLTISQRHLLAAELLRPGGGNVAITRPLGRAKADAVVEVVRALLQRHDALRVVVDRRARVMRPVALESMPTVERRTVDPSELADTIATTTREPFTPARKPLFRALVLECDGNVVFHGVTHHAVADEWSVAIIERDLRELARWLGSGGPPLPPAGSFLEYALSLTGDGGRRMEMARDYWRGELRDFPRIDPWGTATLAQPLDIDYVPVDAATDGRFKDLGATYRVTRFVVLFALVARAIQELSGVEECVLWTTVANRTPATANVVGNFASAMPLRIRAAGIPLDELVPEARRRVLGALRHAHLPMAELLRAAALDTRTAVDRLGTVVAVTGSPTPERSSARFDEHVATNARVTGAPDFHMPYHLRIELDASRPAVESLWYRRGLAAAARELSATWRSLLAG